MPLAACVAIMQNDKMLLTKREDFEVWCLPGGGIEPNESLPQCAIREAKEETGLDIRITHQVGIYSRPRGSQTIHSVLFAAEPVGGNLNPQVSEVIDIGYFTAEEIDKLPLMVGNNQRITDAFNGACGVVWWHDIPWPFDESLDRSAIYTLRDQSGLSRQEFYFKHFRQIPLGSGRLEVDKKQ